MKIVTRNCESEKTLEARLVEEIRKRGGMAVKLTSQFHRGMPDRLVVLPFHTIAFVEMKSTGEKPTPLQEVAMAQLRSMHFPVRVVDSTESLEDFLVKLDERLKRQEADSIDFLSRKREAISKARQDYYAAKTDREIQAITDKIRK